MSFDHCKFQVIKLKVIWLLMHTGFHSDILQGMFFHQVKRLKLHHLRLLIKSIL